MTLFVIILALSVLCQLATAVLALRLIQVTGRMAAWALIAVAITLMAVRRAESLIMALGGMPVSTSAFIFEVVGLITSVLMLAGISHIGPLFSALSASREELRAMNSRLKDLSTEKDVLIKDLQEALNSVKTLKGLLPICSSCKKVRDDKGYWNQIEAYVSEHSEAEFSHGICPECAKKLYPQYYQEASGPEKR
jgi:acid phosphatase family membrane protein YuiD